MLARARSRLRCSSWPQAGAQGGQGPTASVVPVESANAIAISGDPATVRGWPGWRANSTAAPQSGAEIRVYWLEHADAEKLLPVLQQLLGQPVTPSGGGSTGLTPSSSGFLNSSSNGSSSGNSAPMQAAAPVAAPVHGRRDRQRGVGRRRQRHRHARAGGGDPVRGRERDRAGRQSRRCSGNWAR